MIFSVNQNFKILRNFQLHIVWWNIVSNVRHWWVLNNQSLSKSVMTQVNDIYTVRCHYHNMVKYIISLTLIIQEWWRQNINQSLTHWGRDKMVAHFLTTFSNAFSWMKIFRDFTEICSQGSSWLYSSIGLDNGLAPTRRQAIIWNNDG